jgi:hypothetical protein
VELLVKGDDMSTLTTKTATCDICGVEASFGYSPLPDHWTAVLLHERVTATSVRFHSFDLCPSCQGIVLEALELQKAKP